MYRFLKGGAGAGRRGRGGGRAKRTVLPLIKGANYTIMRTPAANMTAAKAMVAAAGEMILSSFAPA